MKATEAVIAWTPTSVTNETTGHLNINRKFFGGSTEWSKPFSHTGGAAFLERQSLSEEQSTKMVFIDFNTLVVRDGIDPVRAHAEFLKIDEYAERISPDMVGARGDTDVW